MEVGYSEALRDLTGRPTVGHGVRPPNRLETTNREILLAFPDLLRAGALDRLRESLRELTGRQHVFFAPSCRAAIARVLSLLSQPEVVMPAYTCPVVKTAVQVAGKRIVYTDTARGSLNSTSAEFEPYATPGRILLPTHLFGIPTDIEGICDLARVRGCVTIEDAAAALGARRRGGLLGTFADVGIYSFERSKRFPAFRGAAIVVNNEEAIDPGRLATACGVWPASDAPLREIAFSLLYNVATVAALYERFVLPRQLRKYAAWAPQGDDLGVDGAVRSPFYTRAFHPFQAALVLRMLSRLDVIREKIARLVSIYVRIFQDSPVMTFLPEERDDAGVLRFPVAIPGVPRCAFLREALQRGLFLETNYERILADDPQDGAFPNARWAAQNVVLLPLYTSLTDESAQRIAKEVVSIASRLGCAGAPALELVHC